VVIARRVRVCGHRPRIARMKAIGWLLQGKIFTSIVRWHLMDGRRAGEFDWSGR
jgi:hypothetical protein